MTNVGIPPQYPGTDHDAAFHPPEGGDWRTPTSVTSPACDYSVYRLLAASLADALEIRSPQEFGVLHGTAYDLVHDRDIQEEATARERLVGLIQRMRHDQTG